MFAQHIKLFYINVCVFKSLNEHQGLPFHGFDSPNMCIRIWVSVCVCVILTEGPSHISASPSVSPHESIPPSMFQLPTFFLSLSPSCSHVIIPFLCHPLCVTLNCLPSTATQIEFCTKFPLHLPCHSAIPALSCSLRVQTHAHRPFLFVINYLRYIHQAVGV